MLRARWEILSVIVVLGTSIVCRGQTGEEALVEQARAIHQRVLTLDSHVDIAGEHYATEKLDPGIDHPQLRCDLVKMTQGGVDGVFLAVYVPQSSRDAQGYQSASEAAMAKFEAIHRLAETMYPDRCESAVSADQVEAIVARGKKAIMIGVENGYPIGEDLGRLEEFHRLGARYITLSHNGHNQICDSCNPRPQLGDPQSEHGGLSAFGERVVAEMNRLGILIDVSHIARDSFYDVLAVSKSPVIASHSGCRALCDHPRNLDDEQLRALAAHGGVIQIVAYGPFLKPPSAERNSKIAKLARGLGVPVGDKGPQVSDATDQQRQQYQQGLIEIDRQYPLPGLKDFVDHIDHAVRVAGIEHVGIGSDFDGGAGIVGFQHHGESPNVTLELVRRGYTEDQIAAIWGGNLLRVWREAERKSAGSNLGAER
jgi:membrane dipeptidase